MVYIGLCSWTEKTLIESGEFYPKHVNSAESRLRYYNQYFKTVEVDSTYYSLPSERNSVLWVQRTTEDFLFHIKAYGAITGHRIDPKTLPKDIQKEIAHSDLLQKRLFIKDKTLRELIIQRFKSSLLPLYESKKLAMIVLQFPPWFVYSHKNIDFIINSKEELMPFSIAVEFRHGSWLNKTNKDTTINHLMKNNITYITSDEPQYGDETTIPFYPSLTTDIAYFRFHGRNKENWLKKGIETSLRYAYEYSLDELQGFTTPIKTIERDAKIVFVMFNNCHQGFAVRNAKMMYEILGVNL